jgi:hypothetical protein
LSWGRGFAIQMLPISNQPHVSPETSETSQDLLPTFALLDHAFNAIHSTIRARDFSICCNMVSLHHIASNLSRPASRASLRRSPLDRLWVSIAVNPRSRLPSLFRARISRTWRLRGIGAVRLNRGCLFKTHDVDGALVRRERGEACDSVETHEQ